MPFRSLAFSVTVAILTIVFAPIAIADEQVLAPKISWQMLQPKDLPDSNHVQAISASESVLAVNDLPFAAKRFVLEQGQSVFVPVPARQWFYLAFAEADPSSKVPATLNVRISDSPGLAQISQWPKKQNVLVPMTVNRIVEIGNTQPDEVGFYLATGEAIDHKTFAPLSWLNDKQQCKRVHASDNRHQDFCSDEEGINLKLNEGKTYWVEGMSNTEGLWTQRQAQLLSLVEQGAGSANTIQTQFLFPQTSRKQLVYQDDKNDTTQLDTMRPGVFKAEKNSETRLISDVQGLLRVQSTDADWLFQKNYQRYAEPDIKQRQQHANLAQALHQAHTTSFENTTAAIKTNSSNPKPKIISDINQLAALNSWLSWQDMPPTTTSGVYQQLIASRNRTWNFASEQEPDLSLRHVSLPAITEKQLFNNLEPQGVIAWQRPEDAVINQIQLQLVALTPADTSGNYLLKVDGEPFTEFELFNPPEMQHLIMDPGWQLELQPGQTSAVSNTSTRVALHTINLPENWQRIELNGNNSQSLARLRYRQPRFPKLDAAQWRTWLENTVTPEYPPVSLARHPHWLHFQKFLTIKQNQFIAKTASPIWQKLIATGTAPDDLFDLTFPEGMSGYQLLQKHLLKPLANQWSYWKQVLTQLRNSGWSGYANDLSSILVRYHSNQDIVEQASRDYFSQLSLAQNDSQQVSLLAWLILSKSLDSEFKQQLILSLAKLFQQQDRHDSALFMLGFAQDSNARSMLIAESSKVVGYHKLAEEYLEKLPPETETELLTNPQQQLNFDALTSVAAGDHIRLYNPQLRTRQNNLLVTPEVPLELTVNSPSELEIEARFWFSDGDNTADYGDDWLNIEFAGQSKTIPLFYNDFRSEGLIHPRANVGIAHRFRVSVPESGTLKIAPQHHLVSLNVKEVSTHYNINQMTSPCRRTNTVELQDFYEFSGFINRQNQPFNCTFNLIEKSLPQHFAIKQANITIDEDSLQSFLQQLQTFEQTPDNQQLGRLNQTLHSWPEFPAKHRLRNRLNRHASWQAQNNPMRLKKSSFYQANTNTPLTPAGYRGRLLYTPFKPEWEKLSTASELNYTLEISQKQQYRLKLLSQKHLFITENSADVEVLINGKLHRSVTLKMGQDTAISLPFPDGKQELSIRLTGIEEQASILALLQFRKFTQNEQDNAWQTQPQNVRLKLFQADEKQPFQQYFPETSWLRIDSFSKQGIINQTFLLAEKGIFSWYPKYSDATSEATSIGHRVYRLQLPPEPSDVALNATELEKIEPQRDTGDIEQTFPRFSYLPNLPNTEAERFIDTPWGLELSQQQRRTPEEDFAQNNRFWQLGAYSQQGDELQGLFSRYDLALRAYDSAFSHSIHGGYQWWDTHWWRNLDLNIALRFAAQDGFRDSEIAWSSRLHVQTQWQYSINRRLFNRFSARLWGNLIESGKDTSQYATAVYSQYKLDHRYGIQLSENFRYKWHHDLESWAQFTLNSNPLSQSELLDNAILVLGSRIYYQGLAADIRWRYQSFMADRNRISKSKDSRLSLALEWFAWQQSSHWRFRFGFDRNLDANENYWSLGLSWNASGLRGVQDYLPQSLAFSALRQQQLSNEILEFDTEQ